MGDVDEEGVVTLLNMGFDSYEARRALRLANNDLVQAVSILTYDQSEGSDNLYDAATTHDVSSQITLYDPDKASKVYGPANIDGAPPSYQDLTLREEV